MTTLVPKYDLDAIGTVNRPFNEKLAETISAFDFGAIGNGIANDTVALQNLIDNGGGYIPPGIYLITSPLVMKDHVHIYGAGGDRINGQFSTVIKWGGASGGNIVQCSVAAYGTLTTNYLTNARISNLSLNGNDIAGVGLYLNNCVNESYFSGINVQGCNLFGVLGGGLFYTSFDWIHVTVCKGIGFALGLNYLSMFNDNDVNGVYCNNIRAYACGDTLANNAAVGYDATAQKWGGCGIYLAGGFQASSVLTSALTEQNIGSGLVIVTEPFAGPRGVSSLYLEGNGGLAPIYAFGSTDVPRFFLDNVYDSTGGLNNGNITIYNESTGIIFRNATGVNNIGPTAVQAPFATRGANFTNQVYGGALVSSIYGNIYTTSNGSGSSQATNVMLPGPQRIETTTGAKTFDGYGFTINTVETTGRGNISLLVTLNINGYGTNGTHYATTRLFIVNFAHRQIQTPAVTTDYDITVLSIGTDAEVGTASGLITGVSMAAVKVSASSAVLRASYTVGFTPAAGYGNVSVSWSASVLTGANTSDVITAL
jgi:hypothetical protein